MTRKWWQPLRNWLRRLNPANDPPIQRIHMPEKHAVAAEQLRIGAELQRLQAEEDARQELQRWRDRHA
jgi:hypothetical protein